MNISDKQVQAVGVIIGYYATATALQDEIAAREDLAGRVVTCHVAGQATSGEAQTIYGKKTFKNEMTVGAGIFPSGTGINIGSNTKKFEGMTAKTGAFQDLLCGTLAAVVGGYIKLIDSILPNDTTIDLGADEAKFGAIHAEILNGVTPSVYTRSGATPGNENPMIPKGSVIMINLIKSDSSNFASGVSACAGEIVSSSGGELADGTAYGAIKVAQYERGTALTIKNEYTTNASRGAISTGMRFKIICGCRNTSAADIITVLAMRMADSV